MRSGIHGTFATLLLMVPVLSIPALAIFGIPQFAPVVASPLDEGSRQDRERRVGQSDRPGHADFPDDLEDDAPAFEPDPADRNAGPAPSMGESIPLHRPGTIAPDVASPDGPRPRGDARRNPAIAEPRQSPFQDPLAQNPRGDRPNRQQPQQPYETRPAGPADEFHEARQTDPAFDAQDAGSTPFDVPPRRVQPNIGQPRDVPPHENGNVRRGLPDADSLTWATAVRRLNELKIRNFRLQPGLHENEFIFICSYTPSDTPRVSYRFEAEADEPLKAVEKVLEQVVEWQQRR